MVDALVIITMNFDAFPTCVCMYVWFVKIIDANYTNKIIFHYIRQSIDICDHRYSLKKKSLRFFVALFFSFQPDKTNRNHHRHRHTQTNIQMVCQ